MKKLPLILAAYLLLPLQSVVFADDYNAEKSGYRFEFKVAKKRAKSDANQKKKPRDRQGQPGPGVEDAEMWLYKVQVENKSLSDLGSLEARYTIYLSPSKSRRTGGPGGGGPGGGPGGRGGGDNAEEPSVRTVTGETTLDPIKRGNREVFETISRAIVKGGDQRGGPPGDGGGQGGPGGGRPGGGGGNGQGGGPDQPRGPEKLDGIKIELFLEDEKIGEHIYGNAAKRAAAAEKKKASREN